MTQITRTLVATLALTAFIASCSHDNEKNLKTDSSQASGSQNSQVEEQKKAEEKHVDLGAELSYSVRKKNSAAFLDVVMKIENKDGKVEEMKAVGPRMFVTSGSQDYDYFEVGKGDVRSVSLLRNDSARLEMVYVITTDSTMNKRELGTNEAYDQVYLFDHGTANELNGSFKAKMDIAGLTTASEEAGVSLKEMVEAVRIALVESTEKVTVGELVDSVKNSFKNTQLKVANN